jgi:hypothetical protein
LLLTDENDFNEAAAVALEGMLDERVYRGAAPATMSAAPYTAGKILFGLPTPGQRSPADAAVRFIRFG